MTIFGMKPFISLCNALNTKCFGTFKLNFLSVIFRIIGYYSISMYVLIFCTLSGCFIHPVYYLLMLDIMKESETGHPCPLCIATRHHILTPTFFFHIWGGCFRFMLDDNLSYKWTNIFLYGNHIMMHANGIL